MKLWGVAVAGLLLGLTAGLIVTWFVVPLEYYDTYPPMLDASYRYEWIRMTAWVYGLEEDWGRTEARLLNLESSEIRAVAVDVLEQATVTGQPVEVLERLAELAAAYGAATPGVAIYGQGGAAPVAPAAGTPTSATPVAGAPVAGAGSAQATPTRAPVISTPTFTPSPAATLVTPSLTPTPTVTETSAIHIISQTLTCAMEPSIAVSLELSRTVEVRGKEQQEIVGLPMREIWLLWDDGADRAITGFRPDLGLGYADFDVIPGRSYNLYVDTPYGRPVLAVQVEPCPPDEGTGWVSRYLVLRDETEARAASDTLTVTLTLTGTGVLAATVSPSATVSPTATLVLTQTLTPVP